MKDEKRMCARCHHEHDYGILRYSADNVPLYGARQCTFERRADEGVLLSVCHCNHFMEADPDAANLPAMTDGEIKELWADTAFLNPQVPLATRAMVRKVVNSGKGIFGINRIAKQWPEFVGLMISQLTDIRGAMVRDDSKFAHLVAHTDEIVESMKGVVQLSERLTGINQRVDDVNERLNKIEGMLHQLLETIPNEAPANATDITALRAYGNAPIRDEAIVTEANPVMYSPTVKFDDVNHGVIVSDTGREFRDGTCSRCHTLTFGNGGTVCPYCGAGGPNPKPLRFVEGMGYMVSDATDKTE